MVEKYIRTPCEAVRVIVVRVNAALTEENFLDDFSMGCVKDGLMKIVNRTGYCSIKAQNAITKVNGTEFGFDDNQVYFQNKSCNFTSSSAAIAVFFVRAYCENNKASYSKKDVRKAIEAYNIKISPDTLKKNLTGIRNTFRVITGATDFDFLPRLPGDCYRFDPNF